MIIKGKYNSKKTFHSKIKVYDYNKLHPTLEIPSHKTARRIVTWIET